MSAERKTEQMIRRINSKSKHFGRMYRRKMRYKKQRDMCRILTNSSASDERQMRYQKTGNTPRHRRSGVVRRSVDVPNGGAYRKYCKKERK